MKRREADEDFFFPRNVTGESYKPVSSIPPTKIDWIIKPIIGRKLFTLFDGDPGLGKSTLSMFYAAQISAGGLMPDGKNIEAANVIYMALEDDPSSVIRPRLEFMGANLNNVYVQEEFSVLDSHGLANLRYVVRKRRPAVIIIDPLYSFADDNYDVNKPNSIKKLMISIQRIANEYNCAIVGIRHVRKAKSDKAIHMGMGSIDVIGQARNTFMVVEDPEVESRRLLVHIKHNITKPMKTLAFKLIEQGEDDPALFRWDGTSPMTKYDLVNLGDQKEQPRVKAVDFLTQTLEKGPVKATEILEMAEKEGFSERTLSRAKEKMGIKSKQKENIWWWHMK